MTMKLKIKISPKMEDRRWGCSFTLPITFTKVSGLSPQSSSPCTCKLEPPFLMKAQDPKPLVNGK